MQHWTPEGQTNKIGDSVDIGYAWDVNVQQEVPPPDTLVRMESVCMLTMTEQRER